jgi:hypothetical protein
MDALAASPFALLDAHNSLRLITDAVHEDDTLCLALTCRPLRDALWARFPCDPAGERHLPMRDGAKVTSGGLLDLSFSELDALPEGFNQLAYLPRPGLKTLDLNGNLELNELPESLWSLTGLEELNLQGCGLRALPEGIGALAGLQSLDLDGNRMLDALPEALWSLVGLVSLDLQNCGLTVLPEEIAALARLRTLDLSGNEELTALPAGLGRLVHLTHLSLDGCPGLVLESAIQALGLPILLAYLRGEVVEGVEQLQLSVCGTTSLSEGISVLTGLRYFDIEGTGRTHGRLTALPPGMGCGRWWAWRGSPCRTAGSRRCRRG